MSTFNTRAFLEKELGRVPSAPANDPINFIVEVIEFLQRWVSAHPGPITEGQSAYCIFVGYERVLAKVATDASYTRHMHFRGDTPQDLLGNVYLVSYPLAAVYGKSVGLANLTDCDGQYRAHADAQQPYVFFNAAAGSATWCTGAENEICTVPIRNITGLCLKPENLEETLEGFHKECTRTPQALALPWRSGEKLIPKRDLEQEIRNWLFVYLRNFVSGEHSVYREVYNSVGRADLLIWFPIQQIKCYLELKVLRKFYPSNNAAGFTKEPKSKMLEWGEAGIRQAYSYKDSEKINGDTYACCFDARGENTKIPQFEALAKSLGVRYLQFIMYPSAAALYASIPAVSTANSPSS